MSICTILDLFLAFCQSVLDLFLAFWLSNKKGWLSFSGENENIFANRSLFVF